MITMNLRLRHRSGVITNEVVPLYLIDNKVITLPITFLAMYEFFLLTKNCILDVPICIVPIKT